MESDFAILASSIARSSALGSFGSCGIRPLAKHLLRTLTIELED